MVPHKPKSKSNKRPRAKTRKPARKRTPARNKKETAAVGSVAISRTYPFTTPDDLDLRTDAEAERPPPGT